MSPRTLLGANLSNKNNCCIYREIHPKQAQAKLSPTICQRSPKAKPSSSVGPGSPHWHPQKSREGWNHHESTITTTFFPLEQHGPGMGNVSETKTLRGQN